MHSLISGSPVRANMQDTIRPMTRLEAVHEAQSPSEFMGFKPSSYTLSSQFPNPSLSSGKQGQHAVDGTPQWRAHAGHGHSMRVQAMLDMLDEQLRTPSRCPIAGHNRAGRGTAMVERARS